MQQALEIGIADELLTSELIALPVHHRPFGNSGANSANVRPQPAALSNHVSEPQRLKREDAMTDIVWTTCRRIILRQQP